MPTKNKRTLAMGLNPAPAEVPAERRHLLTALQSRWANR
jgi:hypothetical protein